MIHVDRSSDLIVPHFLKRRGLAGFKYPELEKVGPEVFDLRKVRRLLPRDCLNLYGKFISKGSEIAKTMESFSWQEVGRGFGEHLVA